MAEVVSSFGVAYESFMNFFPYPLNNLFSLLVLVLVIFIYALLIWKFHKFIAKKDILELNLDQYNQSKHPVFAKVFGSLFYVAEFILLLPFTLIIGFFCFSIFLIALTDASVPVKSVFLISATIIAVIRLAAYYKEDLALDIAKLLPLTLLAVAVTELNLNPTRFFDGLALIPSLFGEIAIYFLFLFLLEVLLRLFDLLFAAFGFSEEEEKD